MQDPIGSSKGTKKKYKMKSEFIYFLKCNKFSLSFSCGIGFFLKSVSVHYVQITEFKKTLLNPISQRSPSSFNID